MKIIIVLLAILFTVAAVADDTLTFEPVFEEWTLFERTNMKLRELNRQQDLQKLDLFQRVHNRLQDKDAEQNFNDVEFGGC